MPKSKTLRLCLAIALLSILGVSGAQVMKESWKEQPKSVPLGIGQLPPETAPQDDAAKLRQYRKAAEQGIAHAQFDLGNCYFQGQVVTQDYAEAVKWFRKAADQGHSQAQISLGMCYGFGKGVAKDEAEAAKWYRKASAQMKDDIAQIDADMRKAAERGDTTAQFKLGEAYRLGIRVPQNHAEAVKWYRRAASQGNAFAQYTLGLHLRKGEGVGQDYVEAVKWYRKAAEQGDADAQNNLGICYAEGEGVPQNDLEAYVWYSLAAAQGNQYAPQNREVVLERMSRGEVVEGQRRAAAFLPKKSIPSEAGESRAGTVPSMSGNQPKSSGTGFFITDTGYLLSNFHVVAEVGRVMVQTKAGLFPALVVKTDAANDLALLKVSGASSGLPVISSRAVKLGSTVATVGFPNIGLQGFAPKLAKGEIGALTGAQDDPRHFQISVPVQPGNSGGALVDERGNVVGVVSAKLSARAALSTSGALPENVNYAVKSSFLLSFLESVPEVAAKLKEPNTKDRKFEDVVKSAEQAAVLVLVY